MSAARATAAATPARILIVGSGSREHALAWRLAQDPGVERVLVAPGNPGHADVAEVHDEIATADHAAILELASREGIDLVVIGPEAPLVAGLADRLDEAGIAAFGPSASAAAVEGSKALCREVAREAGIPMAEGATFREVGPALDYAAGLGPPVVVKADGLAAGKGVVVCETLEDAEAALVEMLDRRRFGEAGATVVIERALRGPEASLIAICDATCAIALPAARDHKRIFDGDRGPNTGGMGAYAPLPDVDDALAGELVARVHRRALAALAARGRPFRGALYAGLMLTAEGPRLLEFNARFGDPEAQAILPLLAVPLAPLLLAAATDRLAVTAADLGIDGPLLPTTGEAAVGVVLAAPGYPNAPRLGGLVEGLGAARASGALVFEAGTLRGPDGATVTAGGRVATVVGRGRDLAEAAGAAYLAADRIRFSGRQMRRDIAAGAIAAGTATMHGGAVAATNASGAAR